MIEKSSTRMPWSGALLVWSCCIGMLLSREGEAALRDQAALDFVGSDRNNPHQGMTQILLEPPIVDRAGHAFRQRRAHAEYIQRSLTKTLHQLSRKHLADGAIFRRRDAVGGKL